MRSYAWVELQLGLLEFGRGRYDEAQRHYNQARKAYSGHWLTDEYVAELRAAQGNSDDAITLYQTLIKRLPRPEFQQQLGDLYLYIGKPDQARVLLKSALDGYLESVGRGEVQYYHHLASLYSDSIVDGDEAVIWAQKDVAIRRNYSSLDALAWAEYRAGKYRAAATTMDAALACGVLDTHLDFHASMIFLAVGRDFQAKTLLKQVAEINPRYQDFHVHR
jgi:tetratricopeptide (TPR) repeat protein